MALKKDGVVAVTGMILVVLSVALIVPAIGVGLESPQTLVLTQQESERVTLTGTISTEAVSIQSSPTPEVNISVVDESNGETRVTNALTEGDSTTVTFPDGDVTIENIDVVSSSEAVIQYDYATYIGYPDNAAIFFENIILFIVVSTFILIIGTLFIISEVFTDA